MPELDIKDREIIDIVTRYPQCKSSDILSALSEEINQSTLSRRMKKLIKEQHIMAQGKGRNTTYSLDDITAYFNQPLGTRSPVTYNPEFLKNYEPNETSFLTDKETAMLMEAGDLESSGTATLNTKVAALYEQFAIDLAYSSSKLEGNTYEYLDTEVLLNYGEYAKGKPKEDAVMILNHRDALRYHFDNLHDINVDEKSIKDTHTLLSHDLANIRPQDEGSYRSDRSIIHIGGSAYQPISVPTQIEEEMKLLVEKASKISNPFEKSLFTMVGVSYIQAFVDVNKRTGRLLSNIPLMKEGFCPLSFKDMDKQKYITGLLAVYELNRVDKVKQAYMEAYLKSAPALRDSVKNAYHRNIDSSALKYRREINKIIGEVVKSHGNKDSSTLVNSELNQATAKEKSDIKVAVTNKLNVLNHNQLVVYGITDEDFIKYRKKHRQIKPKNCL